MNLAARMEGMSEPMRITLSSETYDFIKDDFIFEEKGFCEVKGFGEMEMFFLEGERERTSIRRENLI